MSTEYARTGLLPSVTFTSPSGGLPATAYVQTNSVLGSYIEVPTGPYGMRTLVYGVPSILGTSFTLPLHWQRHARIRDSAQGPTSSQAVAPRSDLNSHSAPSTWLWPGP